MVNLANSVRIEEKIELIPPYFRKFYSLKYPSR